MNYSSFLYLISHSVMYYILTSRQFPISKILNYRIRNKSCLMVYALFIIVSEMENNNHGIGISHYKHQTTANNSKTLIELRCKIWFSSQDSIEQPKLMLMITSSTIFYVLNDIHQFHKVCLKLSEVNVLYFRLKWIVFPFFFFSSSHSIDCC